MKIWAVANQKGGVGKTTSTVSLAGVLIMRGYRVLMLDLDPHGSLTSYFGLDPDEVDPSLYNLFQRSLSPSDVLYDTGFENLALIPAASALATLDKQLGAKEGMGLIIAETLKELESDYDYVLIDCPPMLGLLMVNALAACERLIIPVQTEFLALKGLQRMTHTLEMITKARKKTIQYTIVPTLFDRRVKASIESLKKMREDYAHWIWPGVIPIDTTFRDMSSKGIPLTIARPSNRGGRAYAALIDYLLDVESHSELCHAE